MIIRTSLFQVGALVLDGPPLVGDVLLARVSRVVVGRQLRAGGWLLARQLRRLSQQLGAELVDEVGAGLDGDGGPLAGSCCGCRRGRRLRGVSQLGNYRSFGSFGLQVGRGLFGGGTT